MSLTTALSRKQAFANYVVELMAGFAPVQAKSMFGGHGVYCEGVMFALLVEERLYLKVDEQSLERFTARGLEPFTYEAKGKRMSVQYYEAPPEAYDEPEHMAVWARLGYESALRKQKAKVPKSPKSPTSGKVLQNLGPKSQEMLAKAGIKSEAQLRKLGSVRAYAKTKAVCPKASLNLLWALEGALTGKDGKAVAASERASLLMALDDVQRHDAG